jgi:hypothetical protein
MVAQGGCNSMSSTMLTRDESNQFWTRKNGLKGVPITLKVPTHVQLTLFERHFLVKNDEDLTYRLRLPYVVRDFSQEFIYTEKIFTVDFKRPAAGTYNLRLNLTEDQYIQQFQHDVTDNTIAQVTSLVTQLVPGGLAAQTASGAGGAVDQLVDEVQSVVAVGMFEVDAPDFEDQMAAFVNRHLNQAHDAWVTPPCAGPFNRTTISDHPLPCHTSERLLMPPEVVRPGEMVTSSATDPTSSFLREQRQ